LGLPVVENKLEGPTTCITFLGFELDTDAAEVQLPESKVSKLKKLLQQWQGKRSCMPTELKSLIKKLGHAAQVVVPGKTFLRRMFELNRRWGRWKGGTYSTLESVQTFYGGRHSWERGME